jgi:hypothetical protein
MSAKLDRSQDIKFYFGNANADFAKHLADLFPEWTTPIETPFITPLADSTEALTEEIMKHTLQNEHIHASVDFNREFHGHVLSTQNAPSLSSTQHLELLASLEKCTELTAQLEQKHRLLGFLLADIKRIIG